MIFSSLTFVIFFSIVCVLMALTNIRGLTGRLPVSAMRLRHGILLVASYVFYGWWNWLCCLLMLVLTAVAWFCALGFSRTGRKLYVTLGVVIPLLILGVFKYFNFFVDSFCAVLGLARAGAVNILLPVGISFYTFQSLSYTIDVYREKIAPEKSFANVALYIAFFPQLVAGPIVKAGEFIPQLYEDRSISLKNMERGVQIFAFGLFKKLVIADNISTFADAVFANPAEFNAMTAILALAAYSMQIYCDFSGYSDMAVGCAKCLGYELPRNFDLPYVADSIGEQWRRWHISLSTWLQEYVYIPLGGNRKGKARTYVNLMLTMLIAGLWHGAAWTYVAWGAFIGLGLCAERLLKKSGGRGERRVTSVAGTMVKAIGPYAYFTLGLIFFRSESFGAALEFARAMLRWNSGVIHISSWAVIGIGLVFIGELAAVIRAKRTGEPLNGYYPTVSLNSLWGLAILFIFLGLTLGLAYTGDNPFIYFQF